jgi:hypothetical protein
MTNMTSTGLTRLLNYVQFLSIVTCFSVYIFHNLYIILHLFLTRNSCRANTKFSRTHLSRHLLRNDRVGRRLRVEQTFLWRLRATIWRSLLPLSWIVSESARFTDIVKNMAPNGDVLLHKHRSELDLFSRCECKMYLYSHLVVIG